MNRDREESVTSAGGVLALKTQVQVRSASLHRFRTSNIAYLPHPPPSFHLRSAPQSVTRPEPSPQRNLFLLSHHRATAAFNPLKSPYLHKTAMNHEKPLSSFIRTHLPPSSRALSLLSFFLSSSGLCFMQSCYQLLLGRYIHTYHVMVGRFANVVSSSRHTRIYQIYSMLSYHRGHSSY